MGATAKPRAPRQPAPPKYEPPTAVGVAELAFHHRRLAHNAAAAVIGAAARAEEAAGLTGGDLLIVAIPAGELGVDTAERVRKALGG